MFHPDLPQASELLEEMRVMVAAKRHDLQHHLQELRRIRAKADRNRTERDYFLDRVRIRDESFDLTPPSSSPASHRLRHLAVPRREKEEEKDEHAFGKQREFKMLRFFKTFQCIVVRVFSVLENPTLTRFTLTDGPSSSHPIT